MDPRYDVLDDAARLARQFVDGLGERPVREAASLEELRSSLGRPLGEAGEDPRTVIAELARAAHPGLIAPAGPRFFGFVMGGPLPAAGGAAWPPSAWDRNCGGYVAPPALSVGEEVAAGWVLELRGLPARSSVASVPGCQMAHFTCLAAARHA